MKIKPLLNDYLYLSEQLGGQGYHIEAQPDDVTGECGFIITSKDTGLKLHLPNIEQVKGLVSSECCFKFTQHMKCYDQKFRDVRTLKKELDKDEYCIQHIRSIVSEILK